MSSPGVAAAGNAAAVQLKMVWFPSQIAQAQVTVASPYCIAFHAPTSTAPLWRNNVSFQRLSSISNDVLGVSSTSGLRSRTGSLPSVERIKAPRAFSSSTHCKREFSEHIIAIIISLLAHFSFASTIKVSYDTNYDYRATKLATLAFSYVLADAVYVGKPRTL